MSRAIAGCGRARVLSRGNLKNDSGPSPVRESGPLGSAEVFKSTRQLPVPKSQNDRGSLVVLFGIRIWVE